MIDYIKARVTVERWRVARKFNLSTEDLTKLLKESVNTGEVKYLRPTYFV